MTAPASSPSSDRLVSLDAYRGFVMLAMASSAFSFMTVLKTRPQVLDALQGTRWEGWSSAWDIFYRRLCYQFDHVAWTGCSFWDLIQPSFMFMVGVALPFSAARRLSSGQSRAGWFAHVLLRSFVLVALGIFLSSTGSERTNFTFVNVLTQIGLGYPFLCLLAGAGQRTLLMAALAVLAAYWAAFAVYVIPPNELEAVTQYIRENKPQEYMENWKATELSGFAAHWNMHTNFAAAADRWFLNLFPRNEKLWRDQAFWINDGGYQTLNFIPSLATMIFGLMAGQWMRSEATPRKRVLALFGWGAAAFLVAMAVDTTIWPVQISGASWSLCPAVKRIWSPTWAIFSTGWCCWMLAGFYAVVDVGGWKRLAWPLAIVGMNSIAIYCMAQTLKPWLGRMFLVHARTVDAIAGWNIAGALTDAETWAAPIAMRVVELSLLWLIIAWMYRRRIFIRI